MIHGVEEADEPRARDLTNCGCIPCLVREALQTVDVRDVELVRSSAGGVYVVTAGGELFTDLTLADVARRSRRLVRCHKQYLVNLDAVRAVVRGDGGTTLETRSGKVVPVGRRLVGTVKRLLSLAPWSSSSGSGRPAPGVPAREHAREHLA